MKLNFPVKNAEISVPFGEDFSQHPIKKEFYKFFDNKHPGIDISIQEGLPVYASFSGIVVRNDEHIGMGKVISIRNGNLLTLYGHLRESNVSLGDIVNTGDDIAKSGNTGEATTHPHLHFELRDLSKTSIQNIVQEPRFDEEISNYSPTFAYIVNNANTQKSLAFLSKMYFGTDEYWEKIKLANNLDMQKDAVLLDGTEILIPNYT